jgi:hypothetical protein
MRYEADKQGQTAPPDASSKQKSYQENNFRTMLSKLEEAEQGKLALELLIPGMEMLFDAIDLADADWQEGFWGSWGKLEPTMRWPFIGAGNRSTRSDRSLFPKRSRN